MGRRRRDKGARLRGGFSKGPRAGISPWSRRGRIIPSFSIEVRLPRSCALAGCSLTKRPPSKQEETGNRARRWGEKESSPGLQIVERVQTALAGSIRVRLRERRFLRIAASGVGRLRWLITGRLQTCCKHEQVAYSSLRYPRDPRQARATTRTRGRRSWRWKAPRQEVSPNLRLLMFASGAGGDALKQDDTGHWERGGVG
jgi:hypothetical protein